MESVARILVQIPDPRRHLVRYYEAYSSAARGKRKTPAADPSSRDEEPELIDRIVDHIRRRDKVSRPARPPPHPSLPVASPA